MEDAPSGSSNAICPYRVGACVNRYVRVGGVVEGGYCAGLYAAGSWSFCACRVVASGDAALHVLRRAIGRRVATTSNANRHSLTSSKWSKLTNWIGIPLAPGVILTARCKLGDPELCIWAIDSKSDRVNSEVVPLRPVRGRSRLISKECGSEWVVRASSRDELLLRLLVRKVSRLKRRLLGRGGGGIDLSVGWQTVFFAWHSLNMPLSHAEREVKSISEQMTISIFCWTETASALSVF